MLKGILCPSKISGTQRHPPSVLLNSLFKMPTWEGVGPGMHKRFPVASLVLPYFEGKGHASPLGLWVGAVKEFGFTWSLTLKIPFEVPPCQKCHRQNVAAFLACSSRAITIPKPNAVGLSPSYLFSTNIIISLPAFKLTTNNLTELG